MIECVPRSIFSWGFSITGLSSGSATVEYDWLSEQGRIVGEDVDYDIKKHGLFSGRWTFERAGDVVADAQKGAAMFRRFEVVGEAVNFTVRAGSAFTRSFEILVGQEVVGRIRPAHAFTRRATIECSEEIPEHLQLFAFWLVGLSWKRSTRNNSSGAG